MSLAEEFLNKLRTVFDDDGELSDIFKDDEERDTFVTELMERKGFKRRSWGWQDPEGADSQQKTPPKILGLNKSEQRKATGTDNPFGYRQ